MSSSIYQAGKSWSAEAARLRQAGISLPYSPTAARREAMNAATSVQNRTLVSQMNRSRLASYRGRQHTGANLQIAMPKIRQPLGTLADQGIPYDVENDEELKDIRRWSRLFYSTHDLVPLLIDIYASFPTVGLEFSCFAGDTEVITAQGLRRIEDLAGESHRILTTGGRWVDAPFKDFGEAEVLRVTVQRNGRQREFLATADHRWFIEERLQKRLGRNSARWSALNWDKVDEIRDLAAQGVRHVDIAAQFGVSQPTVSKIVRGHSWTDSQRIADEARPEPGWRKKELLTTELRPGQRLTSGYGRNVVWQVTPSPFGIAAGMVFGDGTKTSPARGARVTLYGHKGPNLLPYYQGCTTATYVEDHRAVQGVTVTDIPSFFKDKPPLTESTSYLYGWLAGYFAADGTVSKKGELFLDSAEEANIAHAQAVCQLLGIKTSDPYIIPATGEKVTFPGGNTHIRGDHYRLRLANESVTEVFFVLPKHRQRWEAFKDRQSLDHWTVVSVEETGRRERVYCPQVPGTEAFVLAGNILTGNCKDPLIERFYTDMFLGDDLNYLEFLPTQFSREYFLSGEVTSLAHFNESLGIWSSEEILNPDTLRVSRSLFVQQDRVQLMVKEMVDSLRNGPSGTGSGADETPSERLQRMKEWETLAREYPEIVQAAAQDDGLDISDALISRVVNRATPWARRGTPFLLRSFRTLMMEESLNAAQAAVADRLYSPMVLATLGVPDLGDGEPWIPDQSELDDVRDDMQSALAADFRLLVHNFGLKIESVFGREAVPNLDNDYARVERKLLQAWGIGEALISGGTGGAYASSALNREVCSVPPDVRAPILQSWRGGPVLRTMEQVWDQAAKHRDVQQYGVQEVIDFPTNNNSIYTVCFSHGMGQWGKIKRIMRHRYDGDIVRLNQKWGECRVTANHSVYAANGDLVNPTVNPELLAVRYLNQPHPVAGDEVRLTLKNSRIEGDWSYRYKRNDTIEKRSRLRNSYKGDQLHDLMRFLGAWIAEGSAHITARGAAVVDVSNNDQEWLKSISEAVSTLIGDEGGRSIQRSVETENQNYNLVMHGRPLAEWLIANAGKGAANKRLPDFVFGLHREYIDTLIEAMVFGDGSTPSSGNWRYFTLSEELAQGVTLLCLLHGIQYTVDKDRRTGVYLIRTCSSYSSRPDERRDIETTHYSGWVYDFEMEDQSVANFTIGVGQPVVHNTQIMVGHQNALRRHIIKRAEIVAEAQGHYDYDLKGGVRVPIYREIVEVDPDTGEERIRKVPKLLIPEVKFSCVVPETQVLTPAGMKNMGDLAPGDPVIGWDDESSSFVPDFVRSTGPRPPEPVVTVAVHSGKSVTCTLDHPFLTQRGWVNAVDLTVGDQVRTSVGALIPPAVTRRFTPERIDVAASLGDGVEVVNNDIVRVRKSGVFCAPFPAKITTSAELWELLGLYVANGACASGTTARWYSKNRIVRHRIETLIGQVFGLKLKQSSGGLAVYSRPLSLWLTSFFGGKSPRDVSALRLLDGDAARAFLDGVTAGKRVLAHHVPTVHRVLHEMASSVGYKNDDLVDPVELARFIGALIGDGNYSTTHVTLATMDQEVGDLGLEAASWFGLSPRIKEHPDNRAVSITFSRPRRGSHRVNERNALHDLLRGEEMWGKTSPNKRVPPMVWEGGPEVRAAFLSGYLDTDGCVQKHYLKWYSVNRPLLEDCQVLLESLGIRSTVRTYKVRRSSPRQRVAFDQEEFFADYSHLTISHRIDRRLCRQQLTPRIPRKIEALAKVISDWPDIRVRDAEWDQVVSVTPAGERETVALEVAHTHKHVTAGITTSNTLNLRDEAQERAFIAQLKAMGVPVSDKTLAVNIDMEFDQELERQADESVSKLMATAQAMKKVQDLCDAQNLPYPPELAQHLMATLQLRQGMSQTETAEIQAEVMGDQAGLQIEQIEMQKAMMEQQMAGGQPMLLPGGPPPGQGGPPPGQGGPAPEQSGGPGPGQGGPPAQGPEAPGPGAPGPGNAPMGYYASLNANGPMATPPRADGPAASMGPELPPGVPNPTEIPRNRQRPAESDDNRKFMPAQTTAKRRRTRKGEVVEQLPRRLSKFERGPSSYGASRRATEEQVSQQVERLATVSSWNPGRDPKVADLVKDPNFYRALNATQYMSQIQADWPEIQAGGASESKKLLDDLLDQFFEVFGSWPQF